MKKSTKNQKIKRKWGKVGLLSIENKKTAKCGKNRKISKVKMGNRE